MIRAWFPIQLSIMCVWTSTESHHVSCFYANCNSRFESENFYMKYEPANQASAVHCTQQFVEIVKWSAFFMCEKICTQFDTYTYQSPDSTLNSIDHIATRNHPRNLFLHEESFFAHKYLLTYIFRWVIVLLESSLICIHNFSSNSCTMLQSAAVISGKNMGLK